jgi:hypothetical protein
MAAYSAHHKAVAAGNGGVHSCNVCGVLVCRQVCDAGSQSAATLSRARQPAWQLCMPLSIRAGGALSAAPVSCQLSSAGALQGTNGEMQGHKDQQAAGVPQNDLEAKLRRRMTIDHQVGPACVRGRIHGVLNIMSMGCARCQSRAPLPAGKWQHIKACLHLRAEGLAAFRSTSICYILMSKSC